MRNIFLVSLLLILVGACSNSPDPSDDGGASDAGHVDAGDIQSDDDAGSEDDAGVDDAGTVDAGQDAGAAKRTDGCPDGAPLAATRVAVLPAPGSADQVWGQHIQGSNSGPTTDFVDLGVIKTTAENHITILDFPDNTKLYRYLRVFAPQGSQGALAEVTFYGNGVVITGKPFGTAGATPANVFDGDYKTTSTITEEGGGYIGLDTGVGFITAAPTVSPTSATSAVDVTLVSATDGASIFYSLDGSEPSLAYTAPIHISSTTTIRAVARSACRLDSAVAQTTVRIGEVVAQQHRSYHIGNSLTDTINKWLKPIAESTGVTHDYARWTIPGSTIKWLYEHQSDGFISDSYTGSLCIDGQTTSEIQECTARNAFDSFVKLNSITDMSLQPYGDPDFPSQGGTAATMFNAALASNPDMQPWIYAQWPTSDAWQTDGFAIGYNGAPYGGPSFTPPTQPKSWEDAVNNYMLYYEQFRDYIQPQVGGKPILIVPAGLALLELKREMEAGQIPGMTGDFFATHFEDGVHLNADAQYLVSLTFYSAMYKKSPEGQVTSAGTTLTAEQAAAFQRIAWTVASGYAGSGI